MGQSLVTMIGNISEKTGKSLDEWVKILQTRNIAKYGEAVKYL